MYEFVLTLHSLLRWVVVATALVAVLRAISGWASQRPYTPTDAAAGRWFVIAMTVQFVLGLLLYAWLSPITRTAFEDMGTAMRNGALRFWAVEHALAMFLAVGLAHVGAARIKKATRDAARRRTAVIFYTLALLLTLAAIPWAGANARPLFRLPF